MRSVARARRPHRTPNLERAPRDLQHITDHFRSHRFAYYCSAALIVLEEMQRLCDGPAHIFVQLICPHVDSEQRPAGDISCFLSNGFKMYPIILRVCKKK
ncbi:hypothetical protein Zmor_007355 [Zophobas morio]|uniref:Uncharacterized protein n=1 Tax=Zophobas morio TaxID=2755281 RepID=A0AA38IX56_9CUCU|nr:hypothetical protein Zmor_007355 [Zophobas morio]